MLVVYKATVANVRSYDNVASVCIADGHHVHFCLYDAYPARLNINYNVL